MDHNKASGPYGLPAKFYETFWEIIKRDLMALCVQLQQGELQLYKHNFGVITMLPKK
jgi:hypothetical protein